MNDIFADWRQHILQIVIHTFSTQGFIWLAITLVCYVFALMAHRYFKGNPIVHPLTLTASAVGLIVYFSGSNSAHYQASASLLHWLLGPATVALALPLYNQWSNIKQLGYPLIIAVAVGGFIAPIVAWACVYWADATLALQMTMLVKSITSPLAMETANLIGGIPALAAVFVIVTGIVGAITAPIVFNLLSVDDPKAQGLSLGAVCHAVGTAKALQMGEQQGALATMGLCLNGIMTAIVLPLLLA
jgi:putative effector of murein hydrolase